MSLLIPNLDDRNFEDLMKEALALIPVYDKNWTNYNPSDPGITLLELFSWLSEMTIYRINRIPEENYRKFLELIGVNYLFEWGEIPGNVTGLLDYLVENFHVDWVKIATIEKNDIDRSINISFKNNFEDHSIRLKLNDEEDKVTIILENGATHDLNVKKELNVYEKSASSIIDGWLFRWNRVPGTDKDRLINSLIQKDSKYKWLRDASLEKTDKGKNLHFFCEGSCLNLRLNDEESEVILSEGVCSETTEEKYRFVVVKDLRIYESIEYDIRRGLQSVSKHYRAITSDDFEFLTNECIEALQEGLSGRAICVNNRDLEYNKGSGDNSYPGHVSVIIIPGTEKPEFSWVDICSDDISGKDNIRLLEFLQNIYDTDWIKSAKIEKTDDGNIIKISEIPSDETTSDSVKSISLKMNQNKVYLESRFYPSYEFVMKKERVKNEREKLNVYCYTVDGKPSDLLKDQVRRYLDKRKLVTTKLHVVDPYYRNVTLTVSISLKKNTLASTVIENVKNSISNYFSPLEGGKDKKGWPVGRNIYKSEIYQLLEKVPGVDHVVEIKIAVERIIYKSEIYQLLEEVPGVDHVVDIKIVDSDLESVELKEYQLIKLTVDEIEVCDE